MLLTADQIDDLLSLVRREQRAIKAALQLNLDEQSKAVLIAKHDRLALSAGELECYKDGDTDLPLPELWKQ